MGYTMASTRAGGGAPPPPRCSFSPLSAFHGGLRASPVAPCGLPFRRPFHVLQVKVQFVLVLLLHLSCGLPFFFSS